MRLYPAFFLLVATAVITAQQPAPSPSVQPPVFGHVTGHVYCSDTQRAARFASVQLLDTQTAGKSSADMLAGLAKDDGKGGGVLGNALTKTMALMMKGSNLSALTAMDGSFSLDKVPPGTYYVIPQMPGYVSPLVELSQKERLQAGDAAMKAVASSAQKIEVKANATATVEINLIRGAAIGGRVQYEDGSPAPGVTPVLLSLGPDGKWKDLPPPSLLPTTTDDRGHYRFSGLPPGKYAIKASLPTSAASMGIGLSSLSLQTKTGDALTVYSDGALLQENVKAIEVRAGEERMGLDIAFPVSGLHLISGAVVAIVDGHHVNSGSVELKDPVTKVSLRTSILEKDGGFRFNYVPDGTYLVAVTSALDMESAAGDDSDNPMMALLLSGKKPKSIKAYGVVEMSITLPGNSEGLELRVPDAHEEKP